ncbi:MAG: tail fiber domain-containing protein, partial [Saprospiraceae bacterium]
VTFTQCTFLGDNTSLASSRTNVTLLGYGIADGQCTASQQVLLGNTATGQIRAQVTGITAYSDARFKTNVKENVAGLDFILKLKPVTYNVRPVELHKIWGTPDSLVNKIDHSQIEQQTQIGFLAQDVETAAKEAGFDFPGIDVPRNDKEVYTLRYVDFIMPIVKSVQELNNKVDQLEKENAQLKEKVGQSEIMVLIEKQQAMIDKMTKTNEDLVRRIQALENQDNHN